MKEANPPIVDTEEGLNYPIAVAYYARFRFIVNLLPLLQNAPDLRRVVTVLAATKEGPIHTEDLQGRKGNMLFLQKHFSSMMTLALEAVSKKAPNVSFIHVYPGAVKTNIGNDVKGKMIAVGRAVYNGLALVIGPLVFTPVDEVGERLTFIATSARFPRGGGNADAGVPTSSVARGTNGKNGSGVYSVSNDGETASPKIEQLLDKLRKDGTAQLVWTDVEKEFTRVTGVPSV